MRSNPTTTNTVFLSTLSLRRATRGWYSTMAARRISIHALLAESDAIGRWGTGGRGNFYPRSPCGERRLGIGGVCNLIHIISIHALLAESDSKSAQNSGALLRI